MIIAFLCTTAFLPTLFSSEGYWTKTAEQVLQEKGKSLRIGIMCAHPNELGKLVDKMEQPQVVEKGMRKYVHGRLWGIDTVIAVARVGKVAAACTTTHLISQYNVDLILYTGVAGATDDTLNIGDVVIAKGLVQHDMDSSPLIPRFYIPFLRIKTFCPDAFLQEKAFTATTLFFTEQLKGCIDTTQLANLKITQPKVTFGIIASGDKFFSDKNDLVVLKKELPEVSCVEMEGASVAQVCYEYDVPCVVIRSISDRASKDAGAACLQFMREVSHLYTEKILNNLYVALQN